MKHLSDSLATFNESFASWLYIMHVNALKTDWPQAPNDVSFTLAKKRAEQDAIAAMEAIQAQKVAKAREMQILAAAGRTTLTDADTTFAGNVTTATGVSSNKSGKGSGTFSIVP